MKHSKLLTKISALLLVGAILLGFSSCANTSYAAKSGDDTVSAGVYLGILINSYYTAASNVEDQQKDLFSQKIEMSGLPPTSNNSSSSFLYNVNA